MKSFILLLLFCWGNVIVAQSPEIAWQNTIGGSNDDQLRSVIQTSDGGYLLGGYSFSGISGDKTEPVIGSYDYWVLKLSVTGDIAWQNTIGGSSIDYLNAVIQTSDGGYLIGGYSSSGISGDKIESGLGGYDYWVVKLDAGGAITWQNTIGGSEDDYLNAVIQTSDGGYLLGGHSLSGVSGDKTEPNLGNDDYWVVKLDADGAIIWQNTIGGSSHDILRYVIQLSDGGYLLGGNSGSGISGDKTEPGLGDNDYWVVKLDADGAIIWQNTIGGSSNDILRSVIQTSDGGYLIGGDSGSGVSGDKTEPSPGGGSDYWVVKLDTSGVIVWQNTIGGASQYILYSVIQTNDGGFLLGGYSYSGVSGDKTEPSWDGDYWVLQLDGGGAIIWQNTIGGSSYEELYSVIQTSDGGFLLGGNSYSEISGDKTEPSLGAWDYWVIKLAGPATCEHPAFVNWTDKTGCTIDLEWTPVELASSYIVRASLLGSPPTTIIEWMDVGATTSTTFESLDNNTHYRFDVRSKCTIEDMVVVSPKISITTKTASCTTPENLIVSDITTDAATISWDVPCDAESFLVAWRIDGEPGPWTTLVPTTDLSATIAGLPAATNIQVGVKQLCPELSAAAFTNFTTPLLRLAEGGLESLAVYPNPTSGTIVVSLPAPRSEAAMLSLFSITGERVLDMQIAVNNGTTSQQIQLSENLPNGLYLLNIQTDTRVFSEQVILLR